LTTLIKAQTGKYLLGLNLTAFEPGCHATTGDLIVKYAFGRRSSSRGWITATAQADATLGEDMNGDAVYVSA
jgi:hypothetical protein